MNMEKTEEIRMFDDPNLVEYRTDLEGWTGPDGLYHGKGDKGKERAIYANYTHKRCECGGLTKKNWSCCDKCNAKKSKENFEKKEQVEWDGVSMMCLYNDDKFFSDMDEVLEYCEDEELEIGDLKLMHCEKQVNISEVNIDELNEEYYTEQNDGGVSYYHPEIAEKVEELNKLIRKAEPKIWFQTNKRIKT